MPKTLSRNLDRFAKRLFRDWFFIAFPSEKKSTFKYCCVLGVIRVIRVGVFLYKCSNYSYLKFQFLSSRFLRATTWKLFEIPEKLFPRKKIALSKHSTNHISIQVGVVKILFSAVQINFILSLRPFPAESKYVFRDDQCKWKQWKVRSHVRFDVWSKETRSTKFLFRLICIANMGEYSFSFQ